MTHNEVVVLEVLRDALIEARLLARKNDVQRVEELCDAFHNVPTSVLNSKKDMERVVYFVEEYEHKYKENLHYRFVDRLKALSFD